MTDSKNIKDCKVLRKLEKDETLKLLEGPIEDASGVTRVRGQSLKDDLVAWVTIKGNAGTVYATASNKFYTLISSTDVPLQSRFGSDSQKVRMLGTGEVVEVLEGPREEKVEAPMRIKGRALADGTVGWLTFRSDALKHWSGNYRCVTGTVMHDKFPIKESKQLRKVEEDEILELLEGPVEEANFNLMRIKARAKKDGKVGWITLCGNQGKVFLKTVVTK